MHTKINADKREILPVQLFGEEFSPVLKSYVVAVSGDDRDRGSLSGRSLCTAKNKVSITNKLIDKDHNSSSLLSAAESILISLNHVPLHL